MTIPILRRTYPYTVEIRSYTFGARPRSLATSTVNLDAAGLETETKARWYILHPAVYHDSFYNAKAPANRQVPSQVTGAIAEAVTLRLFEKLYRATNIEKTSERPNSRTADFAMDIDWNDTTAHSLVETKGSNSPTPDPDL